MQHNRRGSLTSEWRDDAIAGEKCQAGRGMEKDGAISNNKV